MRIGEIRVRAEDIFSSTDPREDNRLFQLANKLHIQTRPEVEPRVAGQRGRRPAHRHARSAFSNVLHIDIAMPLNSAPDVKRIQFLVKTKTSF